MSDPAKVIAEYLEIRDNQLLACDGPARDTLEGCEIALRDVYLIATGEAPLVKLDTHTHCDSSSPFHGRRQKP